MQAAGRRLLAAKLRYALSKTIAPDMKGERMAIRNYRDLTAWQVAMDLVEAICRLTQRFPKEEIYALSSQVRRAAFSIPSNIAEGQGRRRDREFAQFLRIAHGSLRE